MYTIISIIRCTLDLTCWFIDLQKRIAEKTNGQTNDKNQWCNIFKNGGSSKFEYNCGGPQPSLTSTSTFTPQPKHLKK
jgi:hypothetical protein